MMFTFLYQKRVFMRYICLFIFMATFLALFTGCKTNDVRISVANKEGTETEKASSRFVEVTDWNPSTYETVNNLDGVTMTINKETVTSNGLTVTMENNSSAQCIYG